MSNLLDDLDGFDDAFDDAFIDDAVRNVRRFASPNVSRPGSYRPPAGHGTVTQAQLQSAMAKVRAELEKNSAAIVTVNRNAATAAEDQKKVNGAIKRELDGLRGELRQTRELSAILPMLTAGSSVSVTGADGRPVDVMAKNNDTLSMLLPLLLLNGGLGTTGTANGTASAGGLGGDSFMMLALVLAMSKK